jgi:predicted enzyme related to lactoylglutathione lyase
MPPRDGFTVIHFITVANIDRSAEFYEKVFGGRILSRGDSKGASGHIQIANTWLIVNVGGGPTPDKPSVTLSVPADQDKVSSFLNIRVADIKRAMNYGKVEERSSSRSRSPSTARRAATSAILTHILLRSDRAPT